MYYNFNEFQKNAIIKYLGLDKYNYIMNNLYKCDVSNNKDFQTTFNAFYRVRRDNDWRKKYYAFFEKVKNNKNIAFDEILDYMFDKTGSIEASFCSKLLATINPNMPIWDQYVLKNLDLKVEGDTKEDRLENTKKVYKQIIAKEKEKLQDKKIKDTVNEFRKYFSEYNLTDTKIIDYLLWRNRDSIEND